MAELITTTARVFTCLSTPAALDLFPSASRTAPDEALLITAPGTGDTTAADVRARLEASDPAALVIETTDAWKSFTLAGEGAREVFAHLSELHLPTEGFIQGDVGRLAAKVYVAAPDRITMLVPSPQSDYLRERIMALGATPRPEPEDWTAR